MGNLRMWAAIGNIFRVFAVLSLISGVVAVFNVINMFRARAGDNLVIFSSVLAALILVAAFLFWETKPALVSGDPFWARWIAVIYTVLWTVSSVGLALVFIGIAYLLTGEPETESHWRREPDRPPPPRYKAPVNWQPTRRVGPSGTTVYQDPDRTLPFAILDSDVPVQVTERGEGVAQVVAQTGLMGWVDVRTLA